MNIELEKELIIRQFEQINDADLIRAIKSLLQYSLKKQEEVENHIVPEWHKNIVRKRLAEAKANPQNLLSWDDIMKELDS